MATKLKLGTDNNWATKKGNLLAYNDENDNFKPIHFDVTRASTATRLNKAGLIETVEQDRPRVEFDNNNGYVLLEPTRTNSLTYSEDFTNAVYSKQGTSSITSNTTTAPDGSLTADTLNAATGTDVSGNVLRRNVSGTVDATLSIYVKSLGSTSFTIYIRNGSSGVVQSQSITPNDTWQRVTLTHDPDNGQIFFGNTNGNVAIWGAQLEEGSYATSLIPTVGSAVTRTADTCKLENFNNMPTDYPFTVYWSGENVNYGFAQSTFSFIKSGSAVQYLSLDFSNSNLLGFYRRNVNNDSDLVSFSSNIGSKYKIAVKFTSNTTAKVFVGGALVYNLTSGLDVPFDFDTILIGQLREIADAGNRNPCDEFMLFNEALTDAELITLTS